MTICAVLIENFKINSYVIWHMRNQTENCQFRHKLEFVVLICVQYNDKCDSLCLFLVFIWTYRYQWEENKTVEIEIFW